MANEKTANPKNVPGLFFVDMECIDCDLCRHQAPKNFKRDDDGDGKSFICKQPEGTDEEENMENVVRGCPVEAVGKRKQLAT